MNNLIPIEVAYAKPHEQCILAIQIETGSSVKEAIIKSGILERFPEIDLTQQAIGIFGQLRKLTDIIQEGDRIEIYRPLLIDPKEARRRKANS